LTFMMCSPAIAALNERPDRWAADPAEGDYFVKALRPMLISRLPTTIFFEPLVVATIVVLPEDERPRSLVASKVSTTLLPLISMATFCIGLSPFVLPGVHPADRERLRRLLYNCQGVREIYFPGSE
jgi:hypothetical protein